MTIPISEVIGCVFCLPDAEGKLLIGEPAQASEVYPPLHECPSCRASLCPGDIIAVGIRTSNQSSAEVTQDAA